MYYYRIAAATLASVSRLPSFEAFACDCCEADISLDRTAMLPPPGEEYVSGTIAHRRLRDGWYLHGTAADRPGLYVSKSYTQLTLPGEADEPVSRLEEWFIRIAVECLLAHRGCISIHAAALESGGEAVAFTGPSGIGKSTRARAWMNELDARLVSGDRPLIDVRNLELYGVPWDGKEQCFRNVHCPVKVIAEVRRSGTVSVRNMSFAQRRRLLMRQCFLPMWDTETAAVQIANITRLAAEAQIVRAFCGPGQEDARALHDMIQKQSFLKEEPDMKATEGFVLRNIVDEFILMPTGDNIAKFKGTVLLNEVSAFIWEKLQNPVSKTDLLQAVLDEFEVEKAVASADLDVLLRTLKGYGVIEEE